MGSPMHTFGFTNLLGLPPDISGSSPSKFMNIAKSTINPKHIVLEAARAFCNSTAKLEISRNSSNPNFLLMKLKIKVRLAEGLHLFMCCMCCMFFLHVLAVQCHNKHNRTSLHISATLDLASLACTCAVMPTMEQLPLASHWHGGQKLARFCFEFWMDLVRFRLHAPIHTEIREEGELVAILHRNPARLVGGEWREVFSRNRSRSRSASPSRSAGGPQTGFYEYYPDPMPVRRPRAAGDEH